MGAVRERRRTAALAATLVLPALLAATAVANAQPRYVAHRLDIPIGSELATTAVGTIGAHGIALAANGSIAALVSDPGVGEPAHRIFVWRADGTRILIPLPPLAALRRAFAHGRTVSAADLRYVHFETVALAADGTPFATVAFEFSGAFTGEDTAIFRWTGTRWNAVPPPPNAWPSGFTVAAAELRPLRIAMTGDYRGMTFDPDVADRDADYHAPEAWISRGASADRLGYGAIESLAGAYACGYRAFRANRNALVPAEPATYALLWHARAVRRLGRGVALGVNARGVAVGDDRRSADAAGRPMRWFHGGATALTAAPGTAYAVDASGTIVGTLTGRGGFVARNGALTALDRLVTGTHVVAAYATNARGRILAQIGKPGAPDLGYLDPLR